MLQAWALPIENSIGVGGFDLALAANPLTSGVGREGSLGCSASSVPPERLRLSPIEGVSKIKVIEEGDFWSCRRVERLDGESVDLQPCAVGGLGRPSLYGVFIYITIILSIPLLLVSR